MTVSHDAWVRLWGRTIGAVSWVESREVGVFQYAPDFVKSGIQIAPLMMPLSEFPYEFPALSRDTFRGLPGLLADALPDKFGNAVIDAWLAGEGRSASSFHSVERLCYIGTRGMGALEFEPALPTTPMQSGQLEIAKLVSLASEVLSQRTQLAGRLGTKDDRKVIEDILRVGTSAGGARAKAILAWNPRTGAFRSGQVEVSEGFEPWLMKFDGVSNNRDKELADPQGYGRIEYAYYLMAVDAGIDMNPCRLHEEGGRSHFMTRRFDRGPRGQKLHMQSLGAMAHFDYNQANSYSYEQAVQIARRLGLGQQDISQMVLRALFNVMARNQDDHVKNIAFLMNREGQWSLSPAFDVTYAYAPNGSWTQRHQMSLHTKREDFDAEDLLAFAEGAGVKKGRAKDLLQRVRTAIRKWPEFAAEAGVPADQIQAIASAHRKI